MSQYDFSKLDFEEFKNELVSYLKEQDEFVDYQFQGSALNSLLNLLSYVNVHQNYYLNMTTKELYLETCQLYRNAASIARSLNYYPKRKTAAVINATGFIPGVLLESGLPVAIPKYCQFKAEGLTFVTETSYNIYDETPINLILYQKDIIEETFIYSGEPLVLRYGQEIADGEITVLVSNTPWTEYKNDLQIGSQTEAFFVRLNINDKIEIKFGDNTIGKKPVLNSEIKIIYGITRGSEGNGVTSVKLNQVLSSGSLQYSNMTITSDISSGGLNEESLTSIKINAPKYYEAQHRAITVQDYIILLKQLSFIDLVNVWDGSEEIEPVYGTIYATIKPNDINPRTMTEFEKSQVKEHIKKYKPLSLNVQVVDPIYVYIDLTIKLYYYKVYNLSNSAIQSMIQTKLTDYFQSNVLDYNSVLKYSNIMSQIDSFDEISNNLTDIKLRIIFDKTVRANSGYYFYTRNKIKPGSIENEFFTDDSEGNIIDTETEESIGKVNYDVGDVFFFSDKMYDTGNELIFKTVDYDVIFDKNLLPVLGSMNFAFQGI